MKPFPNVAFRRVFLFVYFFMSITFAAPYEQLVKPIRIQEVFSFTQYQLRQALSNFYKNSTALTQVADTRIWMQLPPIRCVGQPLMPPATAEISLLRTTSNTGSSKQKIQESVFLNACDRQFEIFSIERQGANITPTPDSSLLMGQIPNSLGCQFYQLFLRDRKIKIEISEGVKEQNAELVIVLDETARIEIRLRLEESLPAQNLTHQHLNFVYLQGQRTLEDFSMEYIWNLDPKNSVPRQYLYHDQKEIDPSEFLKIKTSIYTKAIFPLIQSKLQFSTTPI